ncbi:O-methyltransferase [Aspergillus sclerotialis]|uniref:O-methyltransferase n=1 Tax=Aspergillus sclerotialis TaxID=2070753 RepID=A0A3A2ZW41_9EURO|nr:O-methyltransferase [Aspergillus sclerotialis]
MPGAFKKEISNLLGQNDDEILKFKAQSTEADRQAAIDAAQNLIRKLQTPQESTINIAYSPAQFLCVRIGIDLDVFNTLASKSGSVSVEEVAAAKKADPILVERVLRVLVCMRYINEDGAKLYSANEMTRHMTHPHSEATIKFVWLGMPTFAKIPEFLQKTKFKNPEGLTSGPFNYAENLSDSLWEWFGSDPERLNICNTFMEAKDRLGPSWLVWFPVKERLVDGFDASHGDKLLVDMAGGRGHDTEAFHKKFPERPGGLVVEDLPHVIEDIQDLDPSIERLTFDLFEKQPIEGARIYYIKFVLHDWSDSDCRKILSNLAPAMKKGYSKLIIEEMILEDTDCAMLQATRDWVMMAFCNSMERTKGHWQSLLRSAGFKVVKFWPPPGDGQGIIEAELE